ncbi:hypothetical protein LCGC14_0852610 [marine sediment metagenome]|uniref:Uncharacterized protein n=1 Tax=marine sediment metagenome TaxID=412755 RepID=A0A0F9RUE2_9ZZZZ
MSIATNETLEYCILNDGYKPTEKEIRDIQTAWLRSKAIHNLNQKGTKE